MPTYEFNCKRCDERFEITCHWNERKEKAVCPKCGGRSVAPVVNTSFKSPSIHPKPF